jgi:hypothetical protein
VKVGSHKWDVLVLAAGGASQVRGYCEDLVGGDDDQGNQGGQGKH